MIISIIAVFIIIMSVLCVCKYLEIRPSPDRSPPGPSVEKHSGQGTFSEQPGTAVFPYAEVLSMRGRLLR
jgi:hypothetical protein